MVSRLAAATIAADFDLRLKHFISFIIAMIIGESLLGLWHGANWNFVVFGLYYGVLISIYYVVRKWWDSVNNLIRVPVIFLLVLVGWIFFRSSSLSESIYVIKSMKEGWSVPEIINVLYAVGLKNTIILTVFIVVVEIVQWFDSKKDINYSLSSMNVVSRWAFYYFIIFFVFNTYFSFI